jgi:hypothetical protein
MLLSDMQCKYHNLPSTALITQRPPPWVHHWLHLPKLVTGGIILILLPFGQDRQKEGGSKEHYGTGKLILWRVVCLAATSSATSTYMICNHM